MKKIKGFVVKNKEGRTYTITETRKQAYEYLLRFLKTQHQEHYASWCNIRGLEDSPEVWLRYVRTCIPDLDGMGIYKCKIPLNILVSAYRVACGCIPLLLEWETPMEVDIYLSRLPENVRDKLKEELIKLK